MEPMKILYDGYIYSAQQQGGISRYFSNLISRLPSTITPVVTTIIPLHNRKITHPNLIPVFYKRFGFKPGRLSYAIEPYYFRIVDQLLDYHIFHPTYYSLLTRQPICKRKVPTVLTVYDMIHEILIEPHKLDRTIELKRYAILSSDMILCISENTKRDLLERYKIPEERIQVTYLATDFPHYPISNDDSYRQAPAVPFFLYVGGRSSYKNFSLLLNAFSKVISKHKDINLCVAGLQFTPEENKIIDELKIQDKVLNFIFPNDYELTSLYKQSLGFVYPSLYEGFGIPPLEAMTCGTPVIASDTSSIPEVVGDAGLLFDPQSTDELVDKLQFILDNPLGRDRLISLGHSRAKEFSWEKTANQTLKVYRNLM